jgi:hypothetical protein
LGCGGATEDGVVNDGGGLVIRNSFFGNFKTGTGAAIRFKGDINQVAIDSNQFETDEGSAIVTEYGSAAGVATAQIVNNRISLGENGANALDFNHKGTLTLSGNLVGNRGASTNRYGWRITPGSSKLALTEGENWLLPGKIDFERDDANIASSRAGYHATDCIAVSGAERGHFCFEGDSHHLFICNASSSDGVCDTTTEWVQLN